MTCMITPNRPPLPDPQAKGVHRGHPGPRAASRGKLCRVGRLLCGRRLHPTGAAGEGRSLELDRRGGLRGRVASGEGRLASDPILVRLATARTDDCREHHSARYVPRLY